MDFLSLKLRSQAQTPRRLPSGSFTVDADGRILSSTVPQIVPRQQLLGLGQAVVASFHEARVAQVSLSELVFQFASLKIVARQLRGGAIIFISAKV